MAVKVPRLQPEHYTVSAATLGHLVCSITLPAHALLVPESPQPLGIPLVSRDFLRATSEVLIPETVSLNQCLLHLSQKIVQLSFVKL